ncbi:glucose-1-phosphate adenylyltransferase large subunit 2, chloroplastic isoform X1 [Brassica rapa]|uniref:glucose-1-phosphate adenylyltransferase large subunit 2, chloroplastic isoform X1 n=1 Tax=Brassica campestris TaxID=3711 RepID=UPI0004F18D59|nr:glucose-1-phosphate adenylyltransferase large subunit 2, chloroplastic isoform X1 [Brassica rapa]XP_009113740.1 glucose-1-phosphate adenylyltransferase large subunit 2, chloroplastic isoform X1 [Brassica rapa]XP_009113742.1 glucose-1-phosphate adenylyltransferase large subunit 2, chloroplastic isoform X1 [Brassica rapa]
MAAMMKLQCTSSSPFGLNRKVVSDSGRDSSFWGAEVVKANHLKAQSGGPQKIQTRLIRSVLTPSVDQESHEPLLRTPRADPKNVASIILGGGAGTRLFPLTSKRAKPAVPIGGCYRLIDIPMSNCINSGIRKIFILTQFNSFSLNRHLSRTYNFGNGVNFGDGFVEVLAATQTSGDAGKKWFQGTADAVRQFIWVFEDAKTKNVEHVLILSGDHLYRMDYMNFVQKHIESNADITVSCLPMDESRASDYGLLKIDESGQIVQFSEKPKGDDLKAMQVDTTVLGLPPKEAAELPYIASMGVYVFRKEVLLNLLRSSYPTSNDFGSEIIPLAVKEHNVQAFLFNDYWEDIGTIGSFFDANLALTEQPPKFQFYDPKTPFFTSPRFLPPTKVDKCRILDSIVSHGCFLRECSVQHSIVGIRSRVESGVELQDTMMMGADFYQTEAEIASLLAEGKVPIGVGENTKIRYLIPNKAESSVVAIHCLTSVVLFKCRNCIIDKNAKIGKNVVIANADGVEEGDRPEEGFYIRSGITVVLKNATIRDGLVL